MSVPVWKRKENSLNLFVEAQDFAVHVLKITRNEKIFKPEFKTEITDRITHLGMDIFLNLWKANTYKIGTNERRNLQLKALENCTDFLAIWNLGIRAFHLKHNKTEYVVGKVISIRETTKKWIKNDTNRHKESTDIENEAV